MAKPKTPSPEPKPTPTVGAVVQRLEDLALGDVLAVDEQHITVQWRAKGGRRVQLARSAQGTRWRIVPAAAQVDHRADVVTCSHEQRTALAAGRDGHGAAYFTDLMTLQQFERDLGRLPDTLRAAWAKLQAASDALDSLLVQHGATIDTWAEAEGIDTPDSVAAAEEAAAENDGAE